MKSLNKDLSKKPNFTFQSTIIQSREHLSFCSFNLNKDKTIGYFALLFPYSGVLEIYEIESKENIVKTLTIKDNIKKFKTSNKFHSVKHFYNENNNIDYLAIGDSSGIVQVWKIIKPDNLENVCNIDINKGRFLKSFLLDYILLFDKNESYLVFYLNRWYRSGAFLIYCIEGYKIKSEKEKKDTEFKKKSEDIFDIRSEDKLLAPDCSMEMYDEEYESFLYRASIIEWKDIKNDKRYLIINSPFKNELSEILFDDGKIFLGNNTIGKFGSKAILFNNRYLHCYFPELSELCESYDESIDENSDNYNDDINQSKNFITVYDLEQMQICRKIEIDYEPSKKLPFVRNLNCEPEEYEETDYLMKWNNKYMLIYKEKKNFFI